MRKNTIALQYYERDWFLNNLNPLAKFLALMSLSLAIFMMDSFGLQLGVLSLSIILFLFSQFDFTRLQGSRILLLTAFFIASLQIIFEKRGVVIFSVIGFNITDQAIEQAFTASARFINVILLSYLFVLTTDPGEFVLSLVQIGLSYRFGYTLTTALRMIPMVRNEVRKILFAQITRGVSFRLFPLKELIRNIYRFIKVILVATMKRVNHLVISMEGRSFGLFPTRTTLSQIHYQWLDYLIISLAIALIPIVMIWR